MKTHQKSSALIFGVVAAALSAQASADYGPAIWNPIPNNYYTSGNGHKFHVIHDMEGFYGSVRSVLINGGLSVHYAVNSGSGTSSGGYSDTDGKPAGEISQFVAEANYAWHVGCWNTSCTGCEHEGFASNPAWYTEAQYQASAGLTAHLANKFGFPKDRNHIVGHDAKSSAAWVSYANANLGINATCNTHHDPGAYWDWSHYMSLITGGGGEPRIDIFVRTPGGVVDQKYWTASDGWSGYIPLAGTPVGSVGACSFQPGRLDLFTRGTDNTLQHKWYTTAGGWSGWESLGGTCASDPCAVSWGAGRIDVFVKSTANTIVQKTYTTAGGWSGFIGLGGIPAGAPAACSFQSGRLDIFARGTDNTLQHKSYNGSWSNWESLGGTLTADPGATSMDAGRIDVFVRDASGTPQISQKYWTSAGGWSGFVGLGGTPAGGPAACSYQSGRLDIFTRGTDNSLQHKWFNGTWSNWESLGGTITSNPGCVSMTTGN